MSSVRCLRVLSVSPFGGSTAYYPAIAAEQQQPNKIDVVTTTNESGSLDSMTPPALRVKSVTMRRMFMLPTSSSFRGTQSWGGDRRGRDHLFFSTLVRELPSRTLRQLKRYFNLN